MGSKRVCRLRPSAPWRPSGPRASYRDSIERNPNHIGPRIGLAACYAEMGQDEDARAQGAEVLRINPKFTLAKYAESLTYRDPAQSEKTLQALRSAGLPG